MRQINDISLGSGESLIYKIDYEKKKMGSDPPQKKSVAYETLVIKRKLSLKD